MRLLRRSLTVLAAVALSASLVQAAEYPERPVRVIVPFGAGGGTDTMARVVAEGLQSALGQSFIVENRAGAGGNIGINAVARAPNDGYTLLVVTSNLAINPLVFDEAGFDPIKDFEPIAMLGSSPVTISVNTGMNINSLQELIDYAKKNPGKISYGTCATGAPQHLAAELLSQMADIEMVHIPYKGCASAIPDHLSGVVPVSFSTIANLAPHLDSGKIKLLAVTGATRSSYAPDTPTVSEAANLEGYDIDVWFAMLAPAGTPQPIIEKLNAAVNEQLKRDEIKAKAAAQSYDLLGGTPQEMADKLKADIERYAKIVEGASIKAN